MMMVFYQNHLATRASYMLETPGRAIQTLMMEVPPLSNKAPPEMPSLAASRGKWACPMLSCLGSFLLFVVTVQLDRRYMLIQF